MVSAALFGNVTFPGRPAPPPPPPPHQRVLGAAAAALGMVEAAPQVVDGFISIEQVRSAELRRAIEAQGAEAGYALVDSHSRELSAAASSGGGGDGGRVADLARQLCVWGDDEHNYRAVYGWVAAHIQYDEQLFDRLEAGDAPDAGDRAQAEAVLGTGTAVCAGFARLAVELAFWCGLEAAEV